MFLHHLPTASGCAAGTRARRSGIENDLAGDGAGLGQAQGVGGALQREPGRDLSATCQAAATPGDPPKARLAAVAAAMRGWALAAPHRYLLIFGTPVPGYQAPPAATAAAATIMAILLDAFAELGTTDGPVSEAAAAFDCHLAGHRHWAAGHPAMADALRHALTFWTRLHGVISLEVAGHFTGMTFDPALLYSAETDAAVNAQ